MPAQKQQQEQQKPQQQQQQPKPQEASKTSELEGSVDLATRVRLFATEVDELKQSVAKLFNGKDISKCLINLTVIKETKMTEQNFAHLNAEMKVRIKVIHII